MDEDKKKKKKDIHIRVFPLVNSSYNEEEGAVRGILTTEQPAIMYDWWSEKFYREILIMKGVQIPENGQVPLLDSHNSWSIEAVKGSMNEFEIIEDRLEGKIRISSVEEKLKIKIKEGHITDLSAGYVVDRTKTISLKKGQSIEFEGTKYTNEYEDGIDLLIQPSWRILEGSVVAIGADDRAKLRELGFISNSDNDGQSVNDNSKNSEIKIKSGEIKKMTDEEKALQDKLSEQEKRNLDNEKILADGKRFGGKYLEEAVAFVAEKKSYDEFSKFMWDKIEADGGAYEKPITQTDMSKKELSEYSVARAIDMFAQGKRSGSLEFEINEDLIKKAHNAGVRTNGGILLPMEVQLRGMRAHSAGTPSEGGYLIQTVDRQDMMEDYLRNELVMGKLGATILTGLQSNITMPRIASGLEAYSVAENSAAAASYLVLDQVTMSPKIVSAQTWFGRQLLIQTGGNIEQVIMRDINQAINAKKDYVALNGTGLNNQPIGFLNQDGINASDMTAASWRALRKFIRDLKKANTFNEAIKWIESADVEYELTSTLKGENQSFYLQEADKIAGYPAIATNQVPDSVLALGVWSQLILGFWGTQEITADPYTSLTEGKTRVVVFDMMDVMLRQPAAFTVSDAVEINE